MRRELELLALMRLGGQYNVVNKALLDKPELARSAMGLDPEDVLAFMLHNDLEGPYLFDPDFVERLNHHFSEQTPKN